MDNQCVICGAEMPEGDQVCKDCITRSMDKPVWDEKGEKGMAGYKKFYKKDAEIFLKLYKRMLMYYVEEMGYRIQTLPTDILERTFDGKDFFDDDFDIAELDKDETWFGVRGLCGYGIVKDAADELVFCHEMMRKGNLVETLARVGHKVNLKKVGPRENSGQK